MTAARKRKPQPANDQRPSFSHRMSYVVLKQPYWTSGRIALASALAVLTVTLATATTIALVRKPTAALSQVAATTDAAPALVTPPAASDTAIAVPAMQDAPAPPSTPVVPAPYDIAINASDLAPQQETIDAVAAKLPPAAFAGTGAVRSKAIDLTIDGAATQDAGPRETDDNDSAAFQAGVAQNLIRRGDLHQALRFAHRAAELEPSNMNFRLQLAILYDRVGDSAGAALLYGQVADAFDAHDATLPADLAIGTIRRRAAYLAATAR